MLIAEHMNITKPFFGAKQFLSTAFILAKSCEVYQHFSIVMFDFTFLLPHCRRNQMLRDYLLLVGFGRACAHVRCAHPSFWAHCHASLLPQK
jgi:hypothetical protein